MKNYLILVPCLVLVSLTGCTNPDLPETRILTEEESRIFNTDDAVLFKQGKDSPGRHLFVFSRIDCPHCRNQSEEFRKIQDITVHTFLVITEKNAKNTIDSWCAYQARRNRACSPDALRRNNGLANRLGINGTPTIIFPNRVMYSGFMTAQQIENTFNEDY